MPVFCPACGQPSHHGSVVPGQVLICTHCSSRIAAPSTNETLPPGDAPAAPQPPAEHDGVPFGRYRLVQEIGRGGMGVVWKAWDMQLGRVVALKQILVGGGPVSSRGERFLREARIAARLQHPRIVSVLDVGEHDGRPYYTAEYVDGLRLEERIRSGVDPRQAVAWCRAVADALQYAHEQGVIHRDVKPGNILVDRDGRPKVMDFGLAKEVRPDGPPGARLTADGVLMGTPQYMSPEQASGKADRIGPASDQFALGVVLYEMLAGKLPFEGETQLDLLNAICDKEPRRLDAVDADVRTVVMKALEKDPAGRYPTIGEMAADLQRCLDGEPIAARRISGIRRLARRAARHRATLVPATLLATAALAVGAWSWIDARKKGAEADIARSERDAASESLRKAGLVQEVLARWARLSDAIAALDAERNDMTKPVEDRRREAAKVWPRVEEFIRATPPDPTAQAAMRALAGWARRLAGEEAEGIEWMRQSRRLDPDLPYGAVVEALVWFTRWSENLPVPEARVSSSGVEFGPAAQETQELRTLRERAEALLVEASSARVWGEGLSREFASTLDAMREMLAGRYEAADAALTRLLAAASTQAFEPDVLLSRGKVRYLQKRFEEALADLERVRKARPGDAAVCYFLGTVRSALAIRRDAGGGDPRDLWREAIHDLDACSDRAPMFEEAQYRRGVAWLGLANAQAARGEDGSEAYARAVADFSHAADAEPPDLDARSGRGTARIAIGQAMLAKGEDPREVYAQAIADFEAVVAVDARHLPALNGLGVAYTRVAEVERATGQDPRASYDRGVKVFTRALAVDGRSASALMNRGILHRMWGDADEAHGIDGADRFASAIADFDAAVAVDPQNPAAYAARGGAWMSRSEREASGGVDPTESFARAVADFDEAVKRNPTDAAVRNNRGNLLRARGDAEANKGVDPRASYGKAIADFDAAIEANPKSSKAYYNRGVARMRIADAQAKRNVDRHESYERAIDDFGKALGLNPQFAQAYLGRGNAWRGLAEIEAAEGKDARATFDKAIADFGEALARNGKLAEAYDGRAVALAHKGDAEKGRGDDPGDSWARALEDYRKALAINPRMWGSHANRGMLLERTGRYEEAVSEYEAAQAIVGDNCPELAGWIKSAREKARKTGER